MPQYMVQPCSRTDLRFSAMQLKSVFGLENRLYFPVMRLLEVLHLPFPLFSYEVVEDREFPEDKHAHTDVTNHVIAIKQSVYDGAHEGNGRDRMTIAHEIGHYFLLCERGFQLQRCFSERPMPAYRDPEWQAKCFAGELLVPAHLVSGMGVDEVVNKCGVSWTAAEMQLKTIRGQK